MAQGSFILYGSKGKVGNVVAQRNKGKTIIREHVIPANPRTKAQQLQRSRFGYLAKFYAEGVKQFFKFSFENKKSNESDYNAFMRENKANMFYATKQMLDNYDSCAFGPYRLTSGSIMGYGSSVVWNEEYGQLEVSVPGLTEDMNWGAISELLIAQHAGWQNGDIITFVTIADANPSATYCDTVEDAIANNSYFKNNAGTIWRFVQVVINTADTKDPTEYGIGVDAGMLTIVPSATEGSSSTLGGGTMVVSRNVANGTEVSDSYLEIGDGLKSHIDLIANDPAWVEHCAKTMLGSEDSILQGSLVDTEEATDKAMTFSPSKMRFSSIGSFNGFYQQRGCTVDDVKLKYGTSRLAVTSKEIQNDSDSPTGKSYFVNFGSGAANLKLVCNTDGTLLSASTFVLSVEEGGLYHLYI